MRFLIIDDHPVFRKALRDLVLTIFPASEFAEAADAEETHQALQRFVPEMILTDLELNHTYDIELIQTLKAQMPDVPILVVSMYSDTESINNALKAGANGYVTKHDAPEHIERAIQTLFKHERYLSDKASSALIGGIQSPAREQRKPVQDLLSEREFEVFYMLGQGYSRKAAADKLSISVATLETHISRIKMKLEIDSGNELLYFAFNYFSKP